MRSGNIYIYTEIFIFVYDKLHIFDIRSYTWKYRLLMEDML